MTRVTKLLACSTVLQDFSCHLYFVLNLASFVRAWQYLLTWVMQKDYRSMHGPLAPLELLPCLPRSYQDTLPLRHLLSFILIFGARLHYRAQS
jgi:hypothetical protein